jgi:hypothetical protein
MKRIAVTLLLAGGCSSLGLFSSPHSDPVSPEIYKHEVSYKLMAHVTGKACASDDEYRKVKGTKSADPRAIGPGYLFERAKFEALEKAAVADGLIAIRARVDVFSNGECVTVVGRPYRITHFAAVPPSGASTATPDDSPSNEVDEQEKQRTAPNDQL